MIKQMDPNDHQGMLTRLSQLCSHASHAGIHPLDPLVINPYVIYREITRRGSNFLPQKELSLSLLPASL